MEKLRKMGTTATDHKAGAVVDTFFNSMLLLPCAASESVRWRTPTQKALSGVSWWVSWHANPAGV